MLANFDYTDYEVAVELKKRIERCVKREAEQLKALETEMITEFERQDDSYGVKIPQYYDVKTLEKVTPTSTVRPLVDTSVSAVLNSVARPQVEFPSTTSSLPEYSSPLRQLPPPYLISEAKSPDTLTRGSGASKKKGSGKLSDVIESTLDPLKFAKKAIRRPSQRMKGLLKDIKHEERFAPEKSNVKQLLKKLVKSYTKGEQPRIIIETQPVSTQPIQTETLPMKKPVRPTVRIGVRQGGRQVKSNKKEMITKDTAVVAPVAATVVPPSQMRRNQATSNLRLTRGGSKKKAVKRVIEKYVQSKKSA